MPVDPRQDSRAAQGISLGAAFSFAAALASITMIAFILLLPRHQPHHRSGQTSFLVRR